MTREEMENEVGPYAANLWRKMIPLNSDQIGVWFQKLSRHSVSDTRQAIANAFSKSKYNEPRLGEILEALGQLTKSAHVAVGMLAEDPVERASVNAENEMMRSAIAGMDAANRTEWVAEITRHEPWYPKLPKLVRMAVLYSRAFDGVAHFYTGAGKERQNHTIPYADYWSMLDQRGTASPEMLEAMILAAKHGI